jgi:hypothetical protein
VGPIPDAPDRPTSINMQMDALEYAPTTGVKGTNYPHIAHRRLSQLIFL